MPHTERMHVDHGHLRSAGLPDDVGYPGGIAALSAMFSRAYVQDLRRAHQSGGVPTIDDPSRGHQS